MRNGITLDPYALLGVRKDATERDVRLAFLRLVRRFHPDKNVSELREEGGKVPGGSERRDEKYKNLIVKYHALYEAYCILKDPKRRREYDEAVFSESLRISRSQTWHKCGGMIAINKRDIEDGFNLFPCSDCSLKIIITF
ncbi:molecular chaperone DnaJ [Cryptosporidium felis]|nr:molecular chaperone DnaJ [Cryptosporidium felis]